ncbi:MAG: DUF2939 domain-containing protein [Deltaproteobacteria bacterium]|nr:DUF2939 domain-containing protein [Deltaproteobacteria bacterium]MBW1952662.1 DUF2939 domain-containing protein [Deltaproteobacteria bacterium]MBW1986209.1 DUF2939 domain-containing protein [Deltaproteobacteria bacterium]MBW2134106.1 DUF2939 domain-containing protein [Deltaproteobacteria bacterium]
MRRKTLTLILVVLAFSGAIILGYLWFWQGTPRHTLYQMVRAIQNRDINNFYKFVDLQAIFNNFINDASQDLGFLNENNQKEEPPPDEFARWSRKLGKKFARYLLPKLFGTFEAQIKGQIERYLLSLSTSETLSLTALVTQAQIQQQGHQAEVTLIDPETKKPLRFRMQQNPDTREWRVVEVNYQDLKEFLKKEFMQ